MSGPQPLWTFADLMTALGAGLVGIEPCAGGPVTGVSIDTRTLTAGDLFVALKDGRDGHEFVTTAFNNGAAAALVNADYAGQGNGTLVRVADPLTALENLGRAARARLSPDARVIAVTGSAGKTTTKEMLRACLTPLGRTHASEKSYNNHWGVPLTLARMPADTQFAVFEIGMNHAGEITPLTKMVRPHVAIITTVEAVHLEHFASVEAIADAKAEIFAGLVPGGTAIIPKDSPYYDLLARRVQERARAELSFGQDAQSRIYLRQLRMRSDGSDAVVDCRNADGSGSEVEYSIKSLGTHNLSNSLAVIATAIALGISDRNRLKKMVTELALVHESQGRGTREWIVMNSEGDQRFLLIDESYNANPASMRAALGNMSLARSWTGGPIRGRRIAVLGDMLELGPDAPRLHEDLAPAIEAAGVALVFACGPNMRHMYDALPPAKRGTWASDSAGIEAALLAEVKAGDVVMIKGSNGSKMVRLVSALTERHRHIPAKTGK